jgi:hypothetical protein
MELLGWIAFAAGMAVIAKTIVDGRRAHHDRRRIMEDVIREGIIAPTALVYALPRGVLSTFALVLLLSMTARVLWVSHQSRRAGKAAEPAVAADERRT